MNIFNPNKKLSMKHYLRRYKNIKYTNLAQMVKGNDDTIVCWSYDKIKEKWSSVSSTGIDTENYVNNVGKTSKLPDDAFYTHYIYRVPPDEIHSVNGENGFFKELDKAKDDKEPHNLPFKTDGAKLVAKVVVKSGSEVPADVVQYEEPQVDNDHERMRQMIVELRDKYEAEKLAYRAQDEYKAKDISFEANSGLKGDNVQDVIENVYDVLITAVDSLLNLDKRVGELELIHV